MPEESKTTKKADIIGKALVRTLWFAAGYFACLMVNHA